MQLGDGANGGNTNESGWYYVHHNTVVSVPGSGISIAGGHDSIVEYNKIDMRTPPVTPDNPVSINSAAHLAAQAKQHGWTHLATNHSINWACTGLEFNNNRRDTEIECF